MFRYSGFQVLAFFIIIFTPVIEDVFADEAASSEHKFLLKKGHLGTCVPNIARQLKSMGLQVTQSKVQLYCECLGNFYFNDLTKSEFSEIEKKQGGLPARVEKQQRAIQEYCVDKNIS